MELEKYAKFWSLRAPEKLASTHTSEVYKVFQNNKPLVLKILNEQGQVHEKNGSVALQAFSGVGAVKLIDKKNNALLLEFVGGEHLSSAVKQGQDQQASEIIVSILDKLHRAEIPKKVELPDLERQFQSLIIRGRAEPNGTLIYKSLKIAEELIASEDSKALLHGDIHHDNILHSSSRGWLGIDPQPLVAERLYDFANCFFNPDDCPSLVEEIDRIKDMAEVFAAATGSSPNGF